MVNSVPDLDSSGESLTVEQANANLRGICLMGSEVTTNR
ncbi:hypothetical protein RintRC_3520 [Richelia intracellularis]|nr:hypothetical protein RintRC_3520 [Richelia intracellularis]